MRTVILLLLLAFGAVNTEAQLLRRIKEKAEQVIDTKLTGSSNNASSGQKTARTASQVKSSELPPANGELVFTLDKNEKFFHDESRIITKNNALNYAFVIRNLNNEFFLIEDGKRTGPFTEAPIESQYRRTGNNEETLSENIKIGSNDKDPVTARHSKTIEGKLFLVFKGKNYGPYDHIAKMLVSPDKNHFFATVTIGGENDMTAKMGMGHTFMVSDEGLKVQAGTGSSVPIKFYASRNFKHCMVVVLDQKTQVINTLTSSGKRAKISMTDLFSRGAAVTFVHDNGDIVTVPDQSPTQVL